MKTELNGIKEEKGYQALLITGSGQHNPAMVYVTGGGHMTHADVIKPAGREAVLFHNPMEREEAAATGLKTKSLVDYNWKDLLAEAQDDPILATALRYKKMFTDVGVTSGKVAVYGKGEVGTNYAVFSAL